MKTVQTFIQNSGSFLVYFAVGIFLDFLREMQYHENINKNFEKKEIFL